MRWSHQVQFTSAQSNMNGRDTEARNLVHLTFLRDDSSGPTARKCKFRVHAAVFASVSRFKDETARGAATAKSESLSKCDLAKSRITNVIKTAITAQIP